MNTSEQHKPDYPIHETVYIALDAANQEAVAVERKHSQQLGFKVLDLDELLDALAPVMRRHGLTLVPTETRSITRTPHEVGRPDNRKTMYITDVVQAFALVHGPSGTQLPVEVAAGAMGTDKAIQAATSSAYRIALEQIFLTRGGADDDSGSGDDDPAKRFDVYYYQQLSPAQAKVWSDPSHFPTVLRGLLGGGAETLGDILESMSITIPLENGRANPAAGRYRVRLFDCVVYAIALLQSGVDWDVVRRNSGLDKWAKEWNELKQVIQ